MRTSKRANLKTGVSRKQSTLNFPKNEKISKVKIAVLGLSPGKIVLLECISAIIDFDVLCLLFTFTVDITFLDGLRC